MTSETFARRTVAAVCILALFACSAPEQQVNPAAPSPSPQIAQGPAPGESTRQDEAIVAGAAQDAISSSALRKDRRALASNQVAPFAAFEPAQRRRDAFPSADTERFSRLEEDTERYAHLEDNAVHQTGEHPVSTFSIDVDTGAYANVRRFLTAGQLPPRDAVRVEEMINYFSYGYATPTEAGAPFAVHAEVAPTPWNINTHLLRIALKGRDIEKAALPPANLVFLIDVSGSMNESRKLPLLKTAFEGLARALRPQDKVSLVVYAGASGVVLEPTAGSDKDRILAALERLSAGGSTHGAAGIELAYRVAQDAFVPGGINRVLLATDGDFNVGITSFESLKSLIEHKRASGISLSTLGFGTGNYNDHLMEQLADAGNGNYSYIDTLNEGRKVLIDEFTSTLATIARDVKIQIEFNPASVAEYRLIGYENRVLRREDFNNDRVDAGEIGAGHTVTALYEIRLAGAPASLIDPLRYREPVRNDGGKAELALLRLRYKAPEGEQSRLMEIPLRSDAVKNDIAKASDDFRFAAAVSAFGQLLKGGRYLEGRASARCEGDSAHRCAQPGFGHDDIARLARGASANDPFGYRAEFVDLVDTARRLASSSGTAKMAVGEE